MRAAQARLSAVSGAERALAAVAGRPLAEAAEDADGAGAGSGGPGACRAQPLAAEKHTLPSTKPNAHRKPKLETVARG